MTQIKTAIIGTGGIARAHVRANQSVGDRTALVAAMDIDTDRVGAFCETHEIATPYTDFETLLNNEKPDLVHICTPPGLHADLSIQAMEAGAWVYCEKPMVASLEELDRVQAVEARTGKHCTSVFQWRFGSGGQHLNHLIQTNAMGDLLVGVCNTVWYRGPDYYAVDWRGKWETEVGGTTMIHGIHAIDFFLWHMGDWTEVRAMIGTLDRDIDVEDVSMALVKFERGAMGSIVNSALSPRQESYLRFDFQKATVELSHLYRYVNEDWTYSIRENADETDKQALVQWQALPENQLSSHDAQLATLLDDMEHDRQPLTSGNEARRTVEFLTSMFKSGFTGQPVQRGSITPDDPFYRALNGGYRIPKERQ
ncbi:MAG: Gfo/Idh/MocA family oxidoreductase [Chloroflexota bacterium]